MNSPLIDRIAGRPVWIKAEALQRSGSFKYRGARNALAALVDADRLTAARGVIAYSSGNHAQGVAQAASELGLPAVIVMPNDAPPVKIENTRQLGAEVVLYDRPGGESREHVGERLAGERGLSLVRPYDDPHVMAGQGTCGLELAEQAAALGIDSADVLVCCGGGGLSSGVAVALEAQAPALRVRTVEPADADDVARSLQMGKRLANARPPQTFCDAIVTPMPGELTFPILERLAGPGLAIDDSAVRRAMQLAVRHVKLVLEPGGAIALAAALSHDGPPGAPVLAIATGGSVDPALLAQVLSQSA